MSCRRKPPTLCGSLAAAAERAGECIVVVAVACVLLSIFFYVLLAQNFRIVVFGVLCAHPGRDHEHAVSESVGLCL